MSCSQHYSGASFKAINSSAPGVEAKSNVGEVILRKVVGTFLTGKRYVGTGGYGDDNWIYFEEPTGDIFKEELMYTGRSKDAIFVSYREYHGDRDSSRPAFYQNLTYSLDSSDVIAFKDYRIRVLEATSVFIR